MTRAKIIAIILLVFGAAYGADAVDVATCESRLQPRATNPNGHYGLFQVGTVHSRPGESAAAFKRRMYSVRANVQTAHRIFVASGRTWSAWSCQP